MLNTCNYFDKIRLPIESEFEGLDGLFGDSDHRFSGLSVPGSAKRGGKDGKLPGNRRKNIIFCRRKVEKHRTSLRQTSVLLWQNIGTFVGEVRCFAFSGGKPAENLRSGCAIFPTCLPPVAFRSPSRSLSERFATVNEC